MKKMLSLLFCIFLMMSAALAAAEEAKPLAGKKLTIALSPNFMFFETVSETEECGYEGLDIDIIKELVAKIPHDGIGGKPGPKVVPPEGRAHVLIEQPRGEAFYYVRGNGTKNLDRFRMRTPTSQNLGGLVRALQGVDLADVPMIILTIDPCISCTER